jgi:hypothetical protein
MTKIYGATVPPVPSPFTIGDTVVYTNDDGCAFTMRVCGFMDADQYARNQSEGRLPGAYVYLSKHPTELAEAYWFPHAESCLEKI